MFNIYVIIINVKYKKKEIKTIKTVRHVRVESLAE